METLIHDEEFEQKPFHEVEKKYLPIFPEKLAGLRQEAYPVEQYYLSHPSEPFSLRLREKIGQDGNALYSAALKDRGVLTQDGLERLEVETEISHEIYTYFKSPDVPILRKLRVEPNKYTAVDFFEDGHIHGEAEHSAAWVAFCDQYRLNDQFMDITGDKITDNEWRAHMLYRKNHEGRETFLPPDELNPREIAWQMSRAKLHSSHTIATIAGRSGSGKTRIVEGVRDLLESWNGSVAILSTDDYHRGKTWLEQRSGNPWTDWDAPIVYDIESLQADLESLVQGESVTRRRFNFRTEEPMTDGVIQPTDFVIVEGIFARHPSFDAVTNLRFELPTPLATSIGRRLLRDMQERPQFANPEKSLKYMLEQAEPSYRAQVESL